VTTAHFLVIRGGRADYAIASEQVREILSPAGWKGPPPVDLGAVLGADFAKPRAAAKLLWIRTAEDGDLALQVSSEIAFCQLAPAEVRPLPDLVLRGLSRPLVRGIVFPQGERPLLVLDPAALHNRPDQR
jgi:chemotaxis signal transduction protein